MTRKKITFISKINSKEKDKFIDDWVKGATEQQPLGVPQKLEQERRFTIVIPEDLYRRLKIKCAKHDIKLKEFVIDAIKNSLIE